MLSTNAFLEILDMPTSKARRVNNYKLHTADSSRQQLVLTMFLSFSVLTTGEVSR